MIGCSTIQLSILRSLHAYFLNKPDSVYQIYFSRLLLSLVYNGKQLIGYVTYLVPTNKDLIRALP